MPVGAKALRPCARRELEAEAHTARRPRRVPPRNSGGRSASHHVTRGRAADGAKRGRVVCRVRARDKLPRGLAWKRRATDATGRRTRRACKKGARRGCSAGWCCCCSRCSSSLQVFGLWEIFTPDTAQRHAAPLRALDAQLRRLLPLQPSSSSAASSSSGASGASASSARRSRRASSSTSSPSACCRSRRWRSSPTCSSTARWRSGSASSPATWCGRRGSRRTRTRASRPSTCVEDRAARRRPRARGRTRERRRARSCSVRDGEAAASLLAVVSADGASRTDARDLRAALRARQARRCRQHRRRRGRGLHVGDAAGPFDVAAAAV